MIVKSYRFLPMVVDPRARGRDVVLEVEVEGRPTAVRIELGATGNEVDLLDAGVPPDVTAGDGTYTIALTVDQVTFGFDESGDLNRNFVGYLRLYTGPTVEAQYNLIVDILTPGIASVDTRVLAPDLQFSDHLVNIVDAAFLAAPSLEGIPNLTRRFYATFSDDYDFINLIYGTPRFENAGHFGVNTGLVSGIGISGFDESAEYGSAGRLLGITSYPLPTYFDAATAHHSHELGHQWINFLGVPPLDVAIPHWPLSDLARGIMGWGQGLNTQGLDFRFHMLSGDGIYRLLADSEPAEYADLALYLMGLMPPEEIRDHFVFDEQHQTPVDGGTLSGPVTRVTVDDVVAALGTRSPAYPDARRVFRVASIIVSEPDLLPSEAMSVYDHFAARGAGETVVSYSLGLAEGQAKPFYLASRRRGRLQMGIARRILVDSSRDGGVWWYPQVDEFDPAGPHQGIRLAEYLRSLQHRVTELPRTGGTESVIDAAILADYDMVIRPVGLGYYHTSEVEAYREFVERGGALLLLADHGRPDDLALGFGLRFEGINRGVRRLSRLTRHPITAGVESLPYEAGSGLTHFPADATILGRLSWFSYLDRYETGRRNRGDPCSPRVLGALTRGFGRVVFCGDANLWLATPQPLVRNTLAWLGGA